ncbi:MAG TPA: OmpA family protein [Phycisphaerales bacterium]|nr:OmpA family protein [Phycisphaerales bacterium]
MKSIVNHVACTIGRAKLFVLAGTIGLLGLTLGGCAGSNNALLMANRSLQEQNTKLVQDLNSLHTLNQQLQDGLSARERAMAELQALVNDLRAGRGDMEAKMREWETKMASLQFGNIALDSDTDRALAALASQHPDLLEYDAARGMIRFKSDVTFDSGKDTLSSSAKSTIAQFAQILNSTAQIYDVKIVGHTDSQPIRNAIREHPTNWHLSCHRAISVLRELVNNSFAAERGEAAGRGEFDPLVPNTARGNTPQNRRVEIFLTKPYRSIGAMKNATTVMPTTTRPAPIANPTKGDDFMK